MDKIKRKSKVLDFIDYVKDIFSLTIAFTFCRVVIIAFSLCFILTSAALFSSKNAFTSSYDYEIDFYNQVATSIYEERNRNTNQSIEQYYNTVLPGSPNGIRSVEDIEKHYWLNIEKTNSIITVSDHSLLKLGLLVLAEKDAEIITKCYTGKFISIILNLFMALSLTVLVYILIFIVAFLVFFIEFLLL